MTAIEWCDETWNPVTGCTKVSPGCAHCYAETFAERFRGVPGHPFEQGFDLKLWPERLTKPLSWKKPRKVFVNSMSDLFHEDVPFEFIDRVFAVMALTPQHTYQVLTKRPERMREYLTGRDGLNKAARQRIHGAVHGFITSGWSTFEMPWPLPNVWLGTSVELQHWLDIRVPELLATPAAVRFLSCEPLLGPLNFRIQASERDEWVDALRGEWYGEAVPDSLGDNPPVLGERIDWVIVGGESGPKAREFDIEWARSVVDQCAGAGVPVFVKQLGRRPVERGTPYCEGERIELVNRKGGDPDEWPEDLRVREMPR